MRTCRLLLLGFGLIGASCGTEVEPSIEPPQPFIHASTVAPDPADHGLFADVNAERPAIWVEWTSDATRKTSGYLVFKSKDSLIDKSTGLLANREQIGRKEPSNDLVQKIDTLHRDTTFIEYGTPYYFQVQAFNRSATNRYTYSKPSPVRSFRLITPPMPFFPEGEKEYPAQGLEFFWTTPMLGEGGFFQVVLEQVNIAAVVWSSGRVTQISDLSSTRYPDDAPPLLRDVPYRWRVKRQMSDLQGGASSHWVNFVLH